MVLFTCTLLHSQSSAVAKDIVLSLSGHFTLLCHLKVRLCRALNCHLCLSLNNACLQNSMWCEIVRVHNAV